MIISGCDVLAMTGFYFIIGSAKGSSIHYVTFRKGRGGKPKSDVLCLSIGISVCIKSARGGGGGLKVRFFSDVIYGRPLR